MPAIPSPSPRMRSQEVADFLRCSKSHLYALDRGGVLRKRTESKRFTYWIKSEVEAVAMGRNPYAAADTSEKKEAPSVGALEALNV